MCRFVGMKTRSPKRAVKQDARPVLAAAVLKQLEDTPELRWKLANDFGRTLYTIDRWVKKNDPSLSTPAVLKYIANYLGISESEALAN